MTFLKLLIICCALLATPFAGIAGTAAPPIVDECQMRLDTAIGSYWCKSEGCPDCTSIDSVVVGNYTYHRCVQCGQNPPCEGTVREDQQGSLTLICEFGPCCSKITADDEIYCDCDN